MDEYISRDDVRRMILEYSADNPKKQTVWAMVISDMLRDLKKIPAADVQPVRRGEWEKIEEYGGWGDTYFRCSICGDEWDIDVGTPVENGMKYCPNCGARMDLKDGDAE